MGRQKSIKSIDKELELAKARIAKLEKRLANEKNQYADLVKERDRIYADTILRAMKSSNKTIDQVMTFLGHHA